MSKGILVVMNEKMMKNLDHLEGRTKMNREVLESKGASDSVHLWHQCLGHMSVKGLKVLVYHKSPPSLKFMNLNFFKYCVFGK